jgi:hypothetical protein
VHGFFGDALVAALTAEPETIEELRLAVARFVKPVTDSSPFHDFREEENFEPYDAGILIIDLAGRLVATDSSYSQHSYEGSIRVRDEFTDNDAVLPYRLSDDWLVVNSVPEYEAVAKQSRTSRLASGPLDVRQVLFGKALLEFIVKECSEAAVSDEQQLFTRIHKKWLMHEREDLGGRAPRDVLLEKQEFIDFDLHSRSLQWSFTKEGPPPLPSNSRAYRFSGFGTNEIVIYYDLVRYLLNECFQQTNADTSLDSEMARLEELRNEWLSGPNGEYDGRAPDHIIQWERRRVNMILSAHDLIIDEDCEICQAMAADFDTPAFWNLDGCNMDEGFEFSFYKTREEFDENERQMEEFNREFDRDLKAGNYSKSFDEATSDPF